MIILSLYRYSNNSENVYKLLNYNINILIAIINPHYSFNLYKHQSLKKNWFNNFQYKKEAIKRKYEFVLPQMK